MRVSERSGTGATVVALAVLLALWGVFLLPLRVGGSLLPVSLALALALGPMCLASATVMGSRTWAIVPALTWLTVSALGLLGGPGGDVLAPVGEIAGVGLGALALGAVSGVAAIAAYRRPSPRAADGRDTPGGAH